MKTIYNKTRAALLLICLPAFLNAQSITTPPSGDNQKASVSQFMGLVEARFTYNSPNLTGPNGEDRKGKIWGELVPWGTSDLIYGTAKQSPWRAGANENTVFYVSHDVKIEGKTLAAGNYGFFIQPSEKGPWTLIFSKSYQSWGGYFYDAAEDVLRVDVTPSSCEFNEWLTYGFEDREPGNCTAFMKWENLKVAFKIEVPDPIGLYLSAIREELKGSRGFSWRSYVEAAQFCVANKINLDGALGWADYAISKPFIGEENFTTLQTKSQVLTARGNDTEATQVMNKAINQPSATVREIHQYGRSLLSLGKNKEAMEVFKLNRQKHPDDSFTTYVGLARGYAAIGDKKNAIKNWETAIKNLPESEKPNLSYYQSEIDKLKK